MLAYERRIAFWSSLFITLCTSTFIVGMLVFSIEPYADWASYRDAFGAGHLTVMTASWLLAMGHLPFLGALYAHAEPSAETLARIGMLFGVCYALLASLNYFSQITFAARHLAESGTANLEHLLLDNRASLIYAQENLAYTFLFLALPFIAPLFREGRFATAIRWAFYSSSGIGLVGVLGYILGQSALELGLLLSALPYFVGMILVMIYFRPEPPSESGD